MKQPLVSIIIPVYNAEKNLAETINSALNQSWANKEIIIVDDGSTDRSVEIAKGSGDAQIKVFQQVNKGSGATRNKGLSEAKGEYIQFLDADDLLSTDKIANQVKLLLDNPGKVAVCSTIHFSNDNDPYKGSPSSYEDSFLYSTDDPAGFLTNLYGGNDDHGSMIQTNAWLTPAAIIKKAGKWSEFYSPDDDGEFFCRVLLASEGIVYSKDCFNYYRKYKSGNNSLASIKTKQGLEGKFKSLLLKREYLLNATKNPAAKKGLARCAKSLAMESYLIDKGLTNEILKTIKELGGTNYTPIMGGKRIEFIKKVFGWKAALNLQHFYSKFK